MTPLFIYYPKCGTCQKALKWLKNNQIEIELRDIVSANPSQSELTEWIGRSGVAASTFFNTSGLKYRALNLKDKVKVASSQELVTILASEGMLVKRPVLITEKTVLVGFKQAEWDEVLLG